MASLFRDLRPGDVISIEAFRYLADKIDELEARVSDLEEGGSGGGVLITSFEPALQQFVGQELIINGTNFAFPPEGNTVTVDNVPVDRFRDGCTSIRLLFLIPPLTSAVPAGGRNVIIKVTNDQGVSAERLYRALPPVPVVGQPPSISDVNPKPLQVGGTAIVTGADFAATPAENIVSIEINTPMGLFVFPPTAGTSLPVTAATPTQLSFTVPVLTGVPPTASAIPAVVKVSVGAHPSATFAVSINR